MNTLEYKNFSGSVNFSAKDDAFFGKIEGINALVTFEGQTVVELKEAFKEAVLDYLELCRKNGINVQKTIMGC